MCKIDFLFDKNLNLLFLSIDFLKNLIDKKEYECLMLYLYINVFKNNFNEQIFIKNFNITKKQYKKIFSKLSFYYLIKLCNKNNDNIITILFQEIELLFNKPINEEIYMVLYNSYSQLKLNKENLLNIIKNIKLKYSKITKNILEKECYLFFEKNNVKNNNNKEKFIKKVIYILTNNEKLPNDYEKIYLENFYNMKYDFKMILLAKDITLKKFQYLNWNYLNSTLKDLHIKFLKSFTNKQKEYKENKILKTNWENEWLNEVIFNKKLLGDK